MLSALGVSELIQSLSCMRVGLFMLRQPVVVCRKQKQERASINTDVGCTHVLAIHLLSYCNDNRMSVVSWSVLHYTYICDTLAVV